MHLSSSPLENNSCAKNETLNKCPLIYVPYKENDRRRELRCMWGVVKYVYTIVCSKSEFWKAFHIKFKTIEDFGNFIKYEWTKLSYAEKAML